MFSSISDDLGSTILLILEDTESSFSFFVNKGKSVSIKVDIEVLVGFIVMLFDDDFVIF